MDRGGLRDIDQIQENEANGGKPRLGSLVLASLGTACVVFAAVALLRRPGAPPSKPTDPLGDLAARAAASAAPRRDLTASDVTFPGILSDADNPTTALAAIQSPGAPSGSAAPFVLPPGSPTVPPPAGDRLPVVPMPAQHVLGASPVVTEPRDPLTTAARDRSSAAVSGPAVEAGHAGAFVLQVASFRTDAEAQAFSNVLRQRGHHAYVETAMIPGRGMWHRVRVGPFKHGREANKYRTEFEAKEHIVPFVIEAEKEKRLAEAREIEKRQREAKRRH